MPYSVGDSELRIVPSQDLGKLGPKEGTPVMFYWRWWYHVPTLPLWAIMLLLLVGLKANRHRQAWLILIPLGLVLVVWRMPAILLSVSDGTTESLGFFVVTGTMAWTMVWLLGHWLGGRHRNVTLLLAFATMLAVGLLSFLSYYSHFGELEGLASSSITYGLCVLILLAAMTHTGYLCRKRFSPRRFLGWLIVSDILVAMGVLLSFAVFGVLVMMLNRPGPHFQVEQLVIPVIVAGVGSVFLGGILYLLNLPFLVLAFRCPFYRERFEKFFGIEKTLEVVPGCPFAEPGTPSTEQGL